MSGSPASLRPSFSSASPSASRCGNGSASNGVGGQYNFVAMAHALPDARSILMLRATHDTAAGSVSNIVYSYGHTTIPRHLRDIVITEYGVAELRGQSDSECVQRLLRIGDSRFQPALMQAAKEHGKLPADWQLPEACTHHTVVVGENHAN